jgi:hypothetical protein
MDYVDTFASYSFKEVNGRLLFFPWGAFGRGYVIPDEQRYLQIRSRVNRNLQVSLFVAAVMIPLGAAHPVLLVPAIGLWYLQYWAQVRALTKDLAVTNERLTLAEGYSAQLKAFSNQGC